MNKKNVLIVISWMFIILFITLMLFLSQKEIVNGACDGSGTGLLPDQAQIAFGILFVAAIFLMTKESFDERCPKYKFIHSLSLSFMLFSGIGYYIFGVINSSPHEAIHHFICYSLPVWILPFLSRLVHLLFISSLGMLGILTAYSLLKKPKN